MRLIFLTIPYFLWRLMLRLMLRLGVVGIAILAIGAAVYWWQAPIRDAITDASTKGGLGFEQVVVFGRVNTPPDQLLEAIAMKRGAPLINADIVRIRHNIENLGWVKEATIERRFPEKLVVHLTEYRALAIYQDAEGHQLISQDGARIHGVKIEDFRHLPVISGTSAPERAQHIIKILQSESELYNEVWSLAYRSGRRWDVFLGNNIRVMLPESDPLSAWQKLAKHDRQHRLTQRNIGNIDLRVQGQIIIKADQPSKAKGSKI